jgi:hypothetical protein
MPASRWESLVWPRWLPVSARMALVAQVTGAVAVTALVMGPWWSSIPATPLPSRAPALAQTPVPAPAAVVPQRAVLPVSASTPAHLNLEVRHTFGDVDLSVTVDGATVLETTLEGSAKKFRMFGKRAERGFTHTLDLQPGTRLVRVRVRSADDRFDQTRVERFELGSAAVAGLSINATKAGLSVEVNRPPRPAPAVATAPAAPKTLQAAEPPQVAKTAQPAEPVATSTASLAPSQADAIAELLQSLRSVLIAIAGFIASAATGFIVQEFLRSRKTMLFTETALAGGVRPGRERVRRRRAKATIGAE